MPNARAKTHDIQYIGEVGIVSGVNPPSLYVDAYTVGREPIH